MKGGQALAQKHIGKLDYIGEEKVKPDDVITRRLPLPEINHACLIFIKKEDN